MAVGQLGGDGQIHAEGPKNLLDDDAEDLSWIPTQVGGGALRASPAARKPRCAALYALGATGAETTASKIADLLRNNDWEVRYMALEALASMPGGALGQTNKIADCLEDNTYHVRARAASTI